MCFQKLDVVLVLPDILAEQCLHLAFILPSWSSGITKWLKTDAILTWRLQSPAKLSNVWLSSSNGKQQVTL